MFNRTTSAYL